MKRNQILFFATKKDLNNLLTAIEAKKKFQYIKTGLFDASVLDSTSSLINTPALGIAAIGDASQEVSYLVVNKDMKIEIRDVPQRRGGTKYAVDQQANSKSIVFSPGGLFNDSCLIDGHVGTISDEPNSLELFSLFKNEIMSQFKKIKSYYVGKEASELLNKGCRLTHSIKTPITYDLKLD